MRRMTGKIIVGLFLFGLPLGAREKPKEKYGVIFLLSQKLICYEDGKEVYRTRISTGRRWHGKNWLKYKESYPVLWKDPAGAKSRSKMDNKHEKYNVSTPWKIILSREAQHLVRLHEFVSVPRQPASHGCIRVPKGKGKWLYDWVEPKKTRFYFRLWQAPKPGTTLVMKQLPELKMEPPSFKPTSDDRPRFTF